MFFKFKFISFEIKREELIRRVAKNIWIAYISKMLSRIVTRFVTEREARYWLEKNLKIMVEIEEPRLPVTMSVFKVSQK